MNLFRREKVITVSDSRQKEKIQEIFAENNIAYKIKVKDKKDRDLARHLAAIR